jgi:arginine N-succinyltransferase
MVVIRPVAKSDLEPLAELASRAGVGLTNLPKDRALLKRRIDRSLASFAALPVERPGGESYLFVMEDLATGKPVGACGIMAKVGGYEPFYSYQIENTVFESKQVNIHKEVPILKLVEEHDGPCEVGSLFLHPDYRGDRNGRFLQIVRFLFMANFPDAFETNVVSELRGVIDESGQSPFWNALGAYFFGIDFAEADRLSIVNKKFIADLMPDHPIYIPLLPKAAQDVIGKPHQEGVRAVKNLEEEGFTFRGKVDIFDAGPVLECPRDQIRTIRQSKVAPLIGVNDQPGESPVYIIGKTTSDFRAVKGPIDTSAPNGVKLTTECAKALKVYVGEPIRFVELKPPGEPASAGGSQ